VRLFVALFPPPDVRELMLAAARQAVSASSSPDELRWTSPKNIHLTIRFLGDVAPAKVGELSVALRAVVRGHEQFDVAIDRLGAFPSLGKARVIWFGVGEGEEAVRGLAADVEEAVSSLGLPSEDRPFSPHVTIARTRGRQVELEAGVPVDVFRFRASRLELVESTLSSRGATYASVASYPLA
jgi:RNA 2',3'-cyclic 3'-phosphodiesterase